MDFTEEVAVLDREGMRLESIDSYRDDSILMENDAAMLLAPRDLKALRMRELNQLAVFRWVQDIRIFHSTPTLYLEVSSKPNRYHSFRFEKKVSQHSPDCRSNDHQHDGCSHDRDNANHECSLSHLLAVLFI